MWAFWCFYWISWPFSISPLWLFATQKSPDPQWALEIVQLDLPYSSLPSLVEFHRMYVHHSFSNRLCSVDFSSSFSAYLPPFQCSALQIPAALASQSSDLSSQPRKTIALFLGSLFPVLQSRKCFLAGRVTICFPSLRNSCSATCPISVNSCSI